MTTPRLRSTAAGPPGGRGPAWERPRARAAASTEAVSAAPPGLVYVNDTKPGIRREKRGDQFIYLLPDGTPLRDEDEIARIRKLAIPPAYTEVWICTNPRGHLQATGRDARGRKQYRYHPEWRIARDDTKFDRMLDFGEALSALRRRIRRDLNLE